MAKFARSKKQKREFDGEDRISKLPDEVLIFILSRMPMKAAAKTSVLSRRWEKLWTSHPCLEFDGSKTLVDVQFQVMGFLGHHRRVKEVLDSQRVRYINWVNQILESHQFPAIDEFRVRFDLNDRHKRDIDEWVRFAFQKRVRRIELDLSSFEGSFIHDKDFCYPLCSQTLGSPSSISLTSLILKQVDVSEEVLDNLISNSPVLERLCVGGSRSLVNLTVAAPSLCLTYLEIINCANMKSLELHAPNLFSLKYSGPQINILFMNDVQNLAELCVGGMYVPYFTHKLRLLSTFAPQLQKLELMGVNERQMKRLEYPILSNLKQLELTVAACDDESLLFFSSLIKASPSLNRLALEVVEMTGFVGKRVDTEFCMYLIENASILEKIIIDPFTSFKKGGPCENYNTKRVKAARECAEQLRSKYSLGDKLVFCDNELSVSEYINYQTHVY
ncbi:hypothetical protein REPUB_Repub07fG0192500 [Reevesia pubescens]